MSSAVFKHLQRAFGKVPHSVALVYQHCEDQIIELLLNPSGGSFRLQEVSLVLSLSWQLYYVTYEPKLISLGSTLN